MRAHVVSLAWGLVVGAAVINSGLITFDTRLFAFDFWDPATLQQFPPDFAIKPTYFLALVMLVMFWAILLNEDDSYVLLDGENSLTLSPLITVAAIKFVHVREEWSWSWSCTTW